MNQPHLLSQRYHQVQQRLLAAREALVETGASQRPEVTLVAVSKTYPPEDIATLASLGQQHFAENYAQEGVVKIEQLRGQFPALVWHFIGPLQSNKTRLVAEHFDWVQSIDRLKIAQRLSEQRPAGLAALQVCLEVNISGQASKSGVALTELLDLAQAVSRLPRLQLRGLMCIPAPDTTALAQQFQQMQQAWLQLANRFATVDTLSMGMSDDFDLAIQYSSTMVRVGTAIFGPRQPKPISPIIAIAAG